MWRAWCNHRNAEWVERAAAFRNLLLVESVNLEFPKRNGRNGFLKQTCPTNLLSAAHQILPTSAAERLAAQPRFQQFLEMTTPWPNLLLVCLRRIFSAAATKGWAWCNHNDELEERAARLKNVKLLVGSGCLEFPKGIAGKDSFNKHVQQISFRQCVTFCEHRQLKGWQPHVQLTVAKSSISTNESLVCSSHKA